MEIPFDGNMIKQSSEKIVIELMKSGELIKNALSCLNVKYKFPLHSC